MTQPRRLLTTNQRRKRTEIIGDALKDFIAQQGLRPGDRLPQEHHLIEALGASKGTIREALRALESQGLIQTRTGPQGGTFITEVSAERTLELLSNYFFFRPPTIHNIYEIRKQLEPALVESITDLLDENAFQRLEGVMAFYDHPPLSLEEERTQRMKELEFHLVLVEYCPNPLMAMMCRFPLELLMNLTVCQRIYNQPYPELRHKGLNYQSRLLEALRRWDAGAARDIMAEHMQAAQQLMEAREAMLVREFLKVGKADGQDHSAEYLALRAYRPTPRD
ncbi:FadR/GntR family transcriptional regulator [Litchfieldella rifensis]|uniref:FadR/GntR family transcriptional regulator n=1 Tax=Litchfieldella rifensis TaxID=762643 RepID=A0ABV7LTJ9_9GAMM